MITTATNKDEYYKILEENADKLIVVYYFAVW